MGAEPLPVPVTSPAAGIGEPEQAIGEVVDLATGNRATPQAPGRRKPPGTEELE
jgi:hypothetical protein